MSPEQFQYIWRKTIPHIEVGMGSGVFTSHRSARPPAFQQASPVGWGKRALSIAKDSIQPQVPLRLPCYDFTPVEDPTVVCAKKTTKSLCGTSGTQKSWVIIGPMLRAKPIPRRTIRTEAIFPDSLRLTALLPIVIAIVALPRECGMHLLVCFGAVLAGRTKPTTKATSKGLSCAKASSRANAHPFSCSLAAIKKQRTLESASNSKGAGSLLTDSTATCWHSISSAGASLGSSAHFGCKDFLLRRMSQQHKTRVSLVIGLDQTSHDTS
uniref:Uncharacterized protein n=1 Tax=Ammopiptanthus mongolicus TaxID=126911 RepID=A0A385G2B1_AMMMO|nr:hypothetical protein [Ammopiptanthus mongolicus]AXV54336.1 hypothetical protein [Ammopiptanthus mongolicus]